MSFSKYDNATKSMNKAIDNGFKAAKSIHKGIKKAKQQIAKAEAQQVKQQANQFSGEFTIRLDPQGHFSFFDSATGYRITDESIIRRIKATPQFVAAKKDLEQQRQRMIDDTLAEFEEETSEIIDISKKSPIVRSEEDYAYCLLHLQKKKYSRELFSEQPVSDEEILNTLKKEAREKVTTLAFWKTEKLREEYVASKFEKLKEQTQKEHLSRISKFEAKQDEIENQENKRFEEEFNAEKHAYETILSRDTSIIMGQIQGWICDFTPVYPIGLFPQYDEDSRMALINVDLPEIDELPQKEVVRLSSGNIKEKAKTQARLKQEFALLAFGLAVYVSANVFSLCANVERILISGYTQKRDKDGNKNDEYIYSIVFNREGFLHKDFSYVDPVNFCLLFPNRSNLTSTMSFKKITPFSLKEAIELISKE